MVAKFNMPEFYFGRDIYREVLNLWRDHPEAFYPNQEIVSVFGCFPGCIWNGGGISLFTISCRQEVRDVIHLFNYQLHIPLRFTFTNPLISEEHLNDTYANMIAEEGHNGMNEILTSSPVLEAYLRKKYPNYKYCKSIIASREEPCDLSGKYDLVVMRRRMNNNWDYLETIPMERRPEIEFLCCDPCPDDCPRIYTHYRDFARATLELDPTQEAIKCSMNKVKGIFQDNYTHKLETYISREAIDKEYLPRGFNQFKLSGRGGVWGPIRNICEYLVKPEYQFDVMRILITPFLTV